MINKKIIINTVFLYFRMLLIMAVTLYTSRIVLEKLGEMNYGIYNVVGGVVAFVSFLNSALSNGFQRYYSIEIGKKDNEGLQKMFSVSLFLQFALIIVVLLITETVGLWFVNNKLVIPPDRMFAANCVYQTSILIFIFLLIRVPFHAMIISYEKMNIFAYISIVEVIAQLLMVYALSWIQADRLAIYGVLMASISFLVMLSYIFYALRCNATLKIKPIIIKERLKSLLGFSGWNTFGSLSNVVRISGLNVLLNMFFTPIVNTANGFANQVSGGVNALAGNILLASQPQVIKNYSAGHIDVMLDISYSIIRYSFCLLWVMSFPLILQMDFIYHIWLGDDTPEYTVIFTRIVLITALIDSSASPLATMVYACGKMRNYQVIVSCIIMMVIPISYIILKFFEGTPTSVFFAAMAVSACAQIARVSIVKQLYPDFKVRVLIRSALYPCLKMILVSVIAVFAVYIATNKTFNINLTSNAANWGMLFFNIAVTALICFFVGLNKLERISIKQKITNILCRI